MEGVTLTTFCIATFLLALMPGPDNLYVLTESIASGKRKGIGIVLGLNLGVFIHILGVIIGVSYFLQKYDFLFDGIKILGALYMFYLAFNAYKDAPQSLNFEKQNAKKEPFFMYLKQGFIMNILNPKVALFFILFLPQFIVPSDVSESNQLFILGLLFIGISLPTFLLFVYLGNFISKWIISPKSQEIINWIKTIVLILIGVFLLLS